MKVLYRPWIIRTLALTTVVYALVYVWWRGTSTLNTAALGFALLLLIAEAVDITSFLLFAIQAWRLKQESPPPPPVGLSVDVLVPTYNEELTVLEATLAGCNAMTYPHTTYVLDDGRRPEVAALAARLNCCYLTRPDNAHAKAGNLNAALPRTRGEFIAVFDADIVPQPDFLEKTLGYFADAQVALVQLPQEFYNRDSMQHATDRERPEPWHEQTLFYRVVQPGRNHWNSTFWCGSPSVVRRAALESVGGVATETVTEDIHTTIRMHARGWKTAFHNEALAYGIAPQTLHAFSVQRLRWGQGTLQLLRNRDNPLTVRGLSLMQRLNYAACILHYFEGYQDLIYVLTPAVVLLTGVFPVSISGWTFLAVWLPFLLLKMLASIALGRGHFRYVRIEQYSLLRMFTAIRATSIVLWSRPLPFRVTPKGADRSAAARERHQLIPLTLVLGVLVLALVLGLVNLTWGVPLSYTRPDVIVVALLWAVLHAGLLAIGIFDVARRLHARSTYRFSAAVTAHLETAAGLTLMTTTEDLSTAGASVVTATNIAVGEVVSVVLHLPDAPLTLEGKVLHRGQRTDGRWRLGITFLPMAHEVRQRLVHFLFVAVPRYQRDQMAIPTPGRAKEVTITASSRASA